MLLPALLQQTAPSDVLEAIGKGIVGLVIVGTPIASHFKGKKRDASRRSEYSDLLKRIDANHEETTTQIEVVSRGLFELGVKVGLNPEDGMRGAIGTIRKDVDGLLTRERREK